MYILTFQSKTIKNLFGSVGVFSTLEDISKRITENNVSQYEGTVKTIEYHSQGQKKKVLQYDNNINELIIYLKENFKSFCTAEIESDKHFWNIREQKDIAKI